MMLFLVIMFDVKIFIEKNYFLLNFFKDSIDFGGIISFCILVVLFISCFYIEVVRKIVIVSLKPNTICYGTLLGKREFLYQQIDSIEEKVLTTRFGLKNKIIKIRVGSNMLVLSKLYTKNYDKLKEILEYRFDQFKTI